MMSFLLLAKEKEKDAEKAWTIVKTNPEGEPAKRRAGYFFAGPSLKVKLGKVKPGTKVYPIEQREDVYHVRFEDGQIGWVYFNMLKETNKLEIKKDTKLYSLRGSTTFRMGKPIHDLKKGDIVTKFGIGKGGGFYRVISAKGKKGAIIRQHAIPAVEKDVPKYNTRKKYQFYFKDEIDAELLQKSDTLLRKKFGDPGALVFNEDKNTWFYTNIETYSKGLRYKGIKFFVKNNIVISSAVVGKGNSSFVDKLPLYLTVKRMNFLKSDGNSGKSSIFKNVSKRHWAVGLLIRTVQFILIVLFFLIAHFFASFIAMQIARNKSLSNMVVVLVGYLISISLNYLYYILLLAHLVQQPYFVSIVMLIVVYLSLNSISRKISYHRCPNCRTMWSAEDKGSQIVGQTHITTNKSKTQHTHTTESFHTITRHHKVTKWKEYSTEQNIRDHRQCVNCGYEWDVERVKVVSGHV
jgi:hypothetical protein